MLDRFRKSPLVRSFLAILLVFYVVSIVIISIIVIAKIIISGIIPGMITRFWIYSLLGLIVGFLFLWCYSADEN